MNRSNASILKNHAFLQTNEDVDAVACDYFLVDDQENIFEKCNCMEKQIACGVMFQKKQLVEIGMYDESFLRHEEIDLRIRFEKKYKIHRLAIPLYRYRRHSKNITNDADAMEHHRKSLVSKHRNVDEL